MVIVVIFVGFGLWMVLSPKSITKKDKRDDPEAVAKVKKAGYIWIAFGVAYLLFGLFIRPLI